MKRGFLALLSAGLLGTLAFANPAAASVLSFTYTNAADGNLSANFSIDVVGGYAVSGTGMVTSSFLSGTDTLDLVTYQTNLPAGDGSINVTNNPVTNGFTWHTVPGGTGADFLVDNVVNTSPLYFDTYGIVFSINSGTSIVGGLNIFDGSPTFKGYSDNFSGGGVVESYAGLGTLTPTPLPAALPLFASGLGAIGFFGWRKKKRKAAVIVA
jgi:hypothetical protein